MCTTSQFIFLCNHKASNAFRDGVCPRPEVPNCYRDHPRAIIVPDLCWSCKREFANMSRRERNDLMKTEFGDRYARVAANEEPPNQFWHIPSRCFVDPGFQRHDPFAADRIKQEIEALENDRYAQSRGEPMMNFRQQFHNVKAVYRHRFRPSPVRYVIPPAACCEGTRIRCWQGLKKLATGKHIDNRCRSGF